MGRGAVWRLLLVALLAVVIVKSAWICDDAYITYRVVDNCWNGYGLRWNTDERVWVFTNPLMMLSMLLLYPLTGEFYYTGIIYCIAVSTVALAIVLVGLAPQIGLAVCITALLAASKAFVDYATSGLENCLTFLLLAVYYWLAFNRDSRRDSAFLAMAAVAGLATLNRMDTLVMFFPLLLLAWWKTRSTRRTLLVVAGFLPFIAWEALALIYYGRMFPNTVYAKLNTGLPLAFYLNSARQYYIQSILTDPVTLLVIFSGLAIALASRRAKQVAGAVGIAAYLAYVFRIGGSFMGGRYFAAPLLGSLMLWCVTPLNMSRCVRLCIAGIVFVAVTATAVFHPLSPISASTDYGLKIRPDLQSWHGINDERGFYYRTTGLMRASKSAVMPAHIWRFNGERFRESGRRTVMASNIGMLGVFGGPELHIIDVLAIADPLLALLPARLDQPVQIGHMERYVPPGYEDLPRPGKNPLEDPGLAEIYNSLRLIHSGPIWDAERWRCIWRLNTGQYQRLIDTDYFQRPPEE